MSSNSRKKSTTDEGSDKLSKDLYVAIHNGDTAGFHQALRNGADVRKGVYDGCPPLSSACAVGNDEFVRILLDAGANPWWRDRRGLSALSAACESGHLSTAEILLNHDNGLLEIRGKHFGWTPLLNAICSRQFEIAHFLLDRGANALATDNAGWTSLLHACIRGVDLRLAQRLLAAGVPLDARDECQRTALHAAAIYCNIDVLSELIVGHNANMFAVEEEGRTPFDFVVSLYSSDVIKEAFFIECYGNILTQKYDRHAFHAVLGAAEYSFAEPNEFHPPQNHQLVIRLPLGKLKWCHFRSLLHSLDMEFIRNRDESGNLPIHIACQNKAPVEVLALIVEQDAAMLHTANYTGALPLHECCCGEVDNSSVRFLVEHGGVVTLAARNRDGALPLHTLCGSTNPSLRTVQSMIQSSSGSVAAQTTAGQYPFMVAACDSSTASLSVVYELVRANPDLVTPR